MCLEDLELHLFLKIFPCVHAQKNTCIQHPKACIFFVYTEPIWLLQTVVSDGGRHTVKSMVFCQGHFMFL